MSGLNNSLLFSDFSFKGLKVPSIKAACNFSKIGSNTSYVAAFFYVFCSNVRIDLVSGSARIEQNKCITSVVQLLVVFFP